MMTSAGNLHLGQTDENALSRHEDVASVGRPYPIFFVPQAGNENHKSSSLEALVPLLVSSLTN
jgi:hypothetical protein